MWRGRVRTWRAGLESLGSGTGRLSAGVRGRDLLAGWRANTGAQWSVCEDLGFGDSALYCYLDGEFWRLNNELRRFLGGCLLFYSRLLLSHPGGEKAEKPGLVDMEVAEDHWVTVGHECLRDGSARSSPRDGLSERGRARARPCKQKLTALCKRLPESKSSSVSWRLSIGSGRSWNSCWRSRLPKSESSSEEEEQEEEDVQAETAFEQTQSLAGGLPKGENLAAENTSGKAQPPLQVVEHSGVQPYTQTELMELGVKFRQKPTKSLEAWLLQFLVLANAFVDTVSQALHALAEETQKVEHETGDLLQEWGPIFSVPRASTDLNPPLMMRGIKGGGQTLAENTKNFVTQSFIIGEVLSTADMTTAVKCGIINWLFSGMVRNLRSSRHVTKWLQQLEQKYKVFAMTERSHGSNVRGIQTEATFFFRRLVPFSLNCTSDLGPCPTLGAPIAGKEPQRRNQDDERTLEFVIHTPCEDMVKMYIGNAVHVNHAAVFAQLIVESHSQESWKALHLSLEAEFNHHLFAFLGPHYFIVPVHNEDGSLYPGVTTVDMMHKEGKVQDVETCETFRCGQVEAASSPGWWYHANPTSISTASPPGGAMLTPPLFPLPVAHHSFGSMAPDRQYHSPVKNKDARFNVMLTALIPSRLGVTFQAIGAMKLGLMIAIRYSHSRRHFGHKEKKEVKVTEHQTQTLRLMPHLASTLALTFTSKYAGILLDKDVFQGKELVDNQLLQALVAGLKAYTQENVRCLQNCHKYAAGMGYMIENWIAGLKDTDVFVTFGGDNVVMLQVVVWELLGQYNKQYKESPLLSLLQKWTESGVDKLRTRNVTAQAVTIVGLQCLIIEPKNLTIIFSNFLALNMDAVGNLTFLLKAVNFHGRVLPGLVARIYNKVVTKKEEDFFSAWNSCLHYVTSLSLAHFHRVTLEQFSVVASSPDQEDQTLLMKEASASQSDEALTTQAWFWSWVLQGTVPASWAAGSGSWSLSSGEVGFFPLSYILTALSSFSQRVLLYGTKLVFLERAWYLEHKYLSPLVSMRIRSQLLGLCDSVKDDALRVISAFNIPHTYLNAPIAGIINPPASLDFDPAPRQPPAQERTCYRSPKPGAKL
ncbi:LOW QUALITY PROTEIN: acyl-coenzyme A oxidase-like protein [Rhynchonycteris naso]